jgi:hypothetical protein
MLGELGIQTKHICEFAHLQDLYVVDQRFADVTLNHDSYQAAVTHRHPTLASSLKISNL